MEFLFWGSVRTLSKNVVANIIKDKESNKQFLQNDDSAMSPLNKIYKRQKTFCSSNETKETGKS